MIDAKKFDRNFDHNKYIQIKVPCWSHAFTVIAVNVYMCIYIYALTIDNTYTLAVGAAAAADEVNLSHMLVVMMIDKMVDIGGQGRF